jgi:hypothetical protein
LRQRIKSGQRIGVSKIRWPLLSVGDIFAFVFTQLLHPTMLNHEPTISVGIYEGRAVATGVLTGFLSLNDRAPIEGEFRVEAGADQLVMTDAGGKEIARGREISCRPSAGGTFTLRDVTIGVQFHWERQEDQNFEGALRFLRREDGTITAINEIPV